MNHYSEKQMSVWTSHNSQDDFIYWGLQFYNNMVELERISASLEEIKKHFSLEAVKMEAKAESNNIDPRTPLVTVQDFFKMKAQEAAKACQQIADNSNIDQFWQKMTDATISTAKEL